MNKKTINIDDKKLNLKIASYKDNGRLALLVYTDDGECYEDLTINLSDFDAMDFDYAFLNNNCSPKLINQLKKDKIIVKAYGKVRYNMSKYELVQFDLEKLKEYDPHGYSAFKSLKTNMMQFYDNAGDVYNNIFDETKNKPEI